MEWYQERVPGLEAAFYSEFLRIVGQAAEAPEMYPSVRSHVRRALFQGFPYAVFYAVDNNTTLVVLACLHERRNPDRWPRA